MEKPSLQAESFFPKVYNFYKKKFNYSQSLNFLLKESFPCHFLHQPLSIHPFALLFNWDHHFLHMSHFPTTHLPQLQNSHNCCNVLNTMATAAKSWANINLQLSKNCYYVFDGLSRDVHSLDGFIRSTMLGWESLSYRTESNLCGMDFSAFRPGDKLWTSKS